MMSVGTALQGLLQEVAAGNPVLVLQNLGLSSWPKWHYANVVGYDLDREIIVLNSGRIAAYELGLSTFNRTWRRSESWGLVVSLPGVLPRTATRQAYLSVIVDLENAGELDAAIEAYETALRSWPDSAVALMGIGNIRYARGLHCDAVEAFADLVVHEPENALAWNNLAYAYQGCGCAEEARVSIEIAVERAPEDRRIAESYSELSGAAVAEQIADYCRVVPSGV